MEEKQRKKKFMSIDLNNLDKLRKLKYKNMFSLIDSIIKGKYFKNKRTKLKVVDKNDKKSFRQDFFNKIIKDRINKNKNYFLFNNNSYYNYKINSNSINKNEDTLSQTKLKENKSEFCLHKTKNINLENHMKKDNYSQNEYLNEKYINNDTPKNKSMFVKIKIINSKNITNLKKNNILCKSCKEIRLNNKNNLCKNFNEENQLNNFKHKKTLLKKERIYRLSPIIGKKLIGLNKYINYNIKGFQKSATDFFHTKNICDIDYQNYYTKRLINIDDIFINQYKNKRKEYKGSKIPFYYYSKSLIKPFNINYKK